MNSDINSYEQDILIDTFNLEIEWEKQAKLYLKYASLHADALLEKSEKKTELNVAKSQLDLEIRKTPLKFGFDKKPTETAILSCISCYPEYIETSKELVEINHQVNVLSAAKEAIMHKKDALENLTKLWLNSYYSEPDEQIKNRMQQQRVSNDIDASLNDNPRLRRKKK